VRRTPICCWLLSTIGVCTAQDLAITNARLLDGTGATGTSSRCEL
jgi:hypothetical protein